MRPGLPCLCESIGDVNIRMRSPVVCPLCCFLSLRARVLLLILVLLILALLILVLIILVLIILVLIILVLIILVLIILALIILVHVGQTDQIDHDLTCRCERLRSICAERNINTSYQKITFWLWRLPR